VVAAHLGNAARSRAETVADQAPQLGLILGRHVGTALGVLQKKFACGGIEKVFFMRKGGRHAAGDIADDFRFPPDRLAGEAAAYVAVNGVGNVRPRSERHESVAGNVQFRFSQIGSRIPRGIAQFSRHDEFGQLRPDMLRLVNVVRLGG